MPLSRGFASVSSAPAASVSCSMINVRAKTSSRYSTLSILPVPFARTSSGLRATIASLENGTSSVHFAGISSENLNSAPSAVA
ncbi:MAG: hypothetical protein BWY62_00262 [Firmicutes bacterium ADurb.Bin356]|nr:MAG: hypothetical protein BWY62_00262 [Firmicutes bacterium ADurb.Bin356]